MMEWILGKMNFKCVISKFITWHLKSSLCSNVFSFIEDYYVLFSQIDVSIFVAWPFTVYLKQFASVYPIRDDEF